MDRRRCTRVACKEMSYVADRKRSRRGNEIYQSFTCISPWFLFRRWLSRGNIRGKERRMKENLDRILEGSRYSEDVADIDREASFNVGVGFGLIYLAAVSRNELNKMAELNGEMQLLLRNLQSEFGNQSKSKSSNHSIAPPSNVSVEENLSTEDIDSGLPHSPSMDQFKENLESAFNCLQIHLDEEELHTINEQYSEIGVEESAPGQWSRDTHLYETSDQQQQHECSGINEYYAVPPRELERKLHELLESQQQERINELETTLDRAMRELEKKRRELWWWKDTARLIARWVPPLPNVARQVKKEAEFDDKEVGRTVVTTSPHEDEDGGTEGRR